MGRAKRSTNDALDKSLAVISSKSTLLLMLAKHEESCGNGMACDVAKAIMRRVRHLTNN